MQELNIKLRKPFLKRPSDTNTYYLLDSKAVVLAGDEDTDGEYALVKISVPPNSGPPMHVHHGDDETFYILRGRVTFYVGEETVTAEAGEHVFAPRGIPHTYKSGDEAAEFLVHSFPAGFDGFVKELGIPVPKDAPLPLPKEPTEDVIQKVLEVSAKYQIFYPDAVV